MMNRLFITCLILAITMSVNSQKQPKQTPLKALKEAYTGKFLIGTASDLSGLSDAELANVKKHYNAITPENSMKPQPIHPSIDRYNFGRTDSLINWSQKNGLKVWGHTLVWHAQTAPWFFQADPKLESLRPAFRTNQPNQPRAQRDPNAPRPSMTEMWLRSVSGPFACREVALDRLKDHIMTVAGRYRGRVIGWDVVNEAIADGGDGSTENLRDFSWYKIVGPDVLTLAFKWARQADPDAELYYNDYNIEQGAVENKGKHASSMLLLKRLIAEGAPITGVGIQGHWHLDTNLEDVEKAIENYASLGLRVAITELDVTATGNNSGAFDVATGRRDIPAENYIQQAEVYKKLFEIFKRHADVIDRVTLWGINDIRSWRRGQDALLFDGEMQPKPAFNAVIEASKSK